MVELIKKGIFFAYFDKSVEPIFQSAGPILQHIYSLREHCSYMCEWCARSPCAAEVALSLQQRCTWCVKEIVIQGQNCM